MAFGSESDFEKDIASNIYFYPFFIFLLLAGCATGGRHDSICFFHWRKMRKRPLVEWREILKRIGRILSSFSYRFVFTVVGEVARFPDELFHLFT